VKIPFPNDEDFLMG